MAPGRPSPRSIAIVGAVLVLIALVGLILPPFVARLTDLGSSVQEGVERVAYSTGERLVGMDRAEVDRMLDDARRTALRDEVGGQALAGVSSLAGALASVMLVLFLCFFLVKDGRRMWTWLLELVPKRRRDAVNEIGSRALDRAHRLHARRRRSSPRSTRC